MTRPEQIRQRVAANDFVGAARLYEDHVLVIRAALTAGEIDPAAIEECRELLEWSRKMAIAFRAQTMDRLQEIQSRQYAAIAYETKDRPARARTLRGISA